MLAHRQRVRLGEVMKEDTEGIASKNGLGSQWLCAECTGRKSEGVDVFRWSRLRAVVGGLSALLGGLAFLD